MKTIFGATLKKEPKKQDKKCPFTGGLKVRKENFVGTCVSAKMHNTVVVAWERKIHNKKYERYFKRKTRVSAHKPEGLEVAEGDRVRIHACRPISKTVHHVVIENLGKERHYLEKKEGKEAGKVKKDVEEKKVEEPAEAKEEKPTQEAPEEQA